MLDYGTDSKHRSLIWSHTPACRLGGRLVLIGTARSFGNSSARKPPRSVLLCSIEDRCVTSRGWSGHRVEELLLVMPTKEALSVSRTRGPAVNGPDR